MPADPADFGAEPNAAEVPVEDVAAARAEFLRTAEPPTSSEPEPVVDSAAVAAAEEAAAIDELTAPPADGGGAAETQTTTAGTSEDPYAQWGGREAVQEQYEVSQALRTEQGVRTMVGQGLLALGYTPEQIRAFVDAQKPSIDGAPAPAPAAAAPAAVPDALAGLDDTDLLDVKTVKDLLPQLINQAVQQATAAATAQVQPVAQTLAERDQAAVQTMANSTYVELLGAPPEDPAAALAYNDSVAEVQQIAQRLLGDYPATPENIRNVLIRGHAEFVERQERVFKAYIHGKKAAAAAQPTNLGGGAVPTDGPAPEPKNLAESRALARAEGLFG